MHSGAKCTRKKKLQIIDNNVIIITEWRAREGKRENIREREREKEKEKERKTEKEKENAGWKERERWREC